VNEIGVRVGTLLMDRRRFVLSVCVVSLCFSLCCQFVFQFVLSVCVVSLSCQFVLSVCVVSLFQFVLSVGVVSLLV